MIEANNTETIALQNKPCPPAFFKQKISIALLLALSLSVCLLYQDSAAWLFSIWHEKAYSHGFFVPLISLYLVWEQRERFNNLPANPAYASGITIIFSCLALLIASRFSAIIQIEALAFFFIIPGIILLICGSKIMRAALLPWLYLSFMLPWLEPLLARIQHHFQLVSSIMGATLLNLFLPVYRNGIYIQLPNISMEVAQECSGVNFFISILAIGIPLVYLTQRTWPKALMVLAIGCILTLLSNGLRVALAGFMGQYYGSELLHGPNHIFQGWFVAWLGWIGLFLVNWLVAKYSNKNIPLLYERWKHSPLLKESPPSSQPHFIKRLCYATAFLLVCYGVVAYVSPHPNLLPTPLTSLSFQQGDWTGSDDAWLHAESFFPNSDASLSRVYRSASGGEKVFLYIAYYEKQSEQKRIISQYSRPLHKGSESITISDTLSIGLQLQATQGELTINSVPYDTVFWYQFPGQIVTSERNKARLAALKSGIFTHKNAGAIILLATPNANTSSENASGPPTPIIRFLKSAGPSLYSLIP